jgi:glycerate 2-kinase
VQVVDPDGAPLPPGGAALVGAAGWAPPPGGSKATFLPSDGGMVAFLPSGDGVVRLVAAADVDNPLLGPHGAAAVFGPQKGADDAAVAELDVALATFADVLASLGRDVRDEPGAGAAGGLGAALLALGAERVSGAGLVRDLVGLGPALDGADLAITGEGSFDWQSLRGKLVTAVAQGAAERGVPCLVLAGQVSVGRREAAAAGVDAAYSVTEDAGGLEASLADPAGTLAGLASRVAGTWSRG